MVRIGLSQEEDSSLPLTRLRTNKSDLLLRSLRSLQTSLNGSKIPVRKLSSFSVHPSIVTSRISMETSTTMIDAAEEPRETSNSSIQSNDSRKRKPSSPAKAAKGKKTRQGKNGQTSTPSPPNRSSDSSIQLRPRRTLKTKQIRLPTFKFDPEPSVIFDTAPAPDSEGDDPLLLYGRSGWEKEDGNRLLKLMRKTIDKAPVYRSIGTSMTPLPHSTRFNRIVEGDTELGMQFVDSDQEGDDWGANLNVWPEEERNPKQGERQHLNKRDFGLSFIGPRRYSPIQLKSSIIQSTPLHMRSKHLSFLVEPVTPNMDNSFVSAIQDTIEEIPLTVFSPSPSLPASHSPSPTPVSPPSYLSENSKATNFHSLINHKDQPDASATFYDAPNTKNVAQIMNEPIIEKMETEDANDVFNEEIDRLIAEYSQSSISGHLSFESSTQHTPEQYRTTMDIQPEQEYSTVDAEVTLEPDSEPEGFSPKRRHARRSSPHPSFGDVSERPTRLFLRSMNTTKKNRLASPEIFQQALEESNFKSKGADIRAIASTLSPEPQSVAVVAGEPVFPQQDDVLRSSPRSLKQELRAAETAPVDQFMMSSSPTFDQDFETIRELSAIYSKPILDNINHDYGELSTDPATTNQQEPEREPEREPEQESERELELKPELELGTSISISGAGNTSIQDEYFDASMLNISGEFTAPLPTTSDSDLSKAGTSNSLNGEQFRLMEIPTINISSSDAQATARVAAILKVYHDYTPEGNHSAPKRIINTLLQTEEQSLRMRSPHPASPGFQLSSDDGVFLKPGPRHARQPSPATSISSIPSSFVGLGTQSVTNPSIVSTTSNFGIVQVSNMLSWTTKEWRKLEEVLVSQERRSKRTHRPVSSEEVVSVFLLLNGLNKSKCEHQWKWSKLVLRVEALRERRSRDRKRREGSSFFSPTNGSNVDLSKSVLPKGLTHNNGAASTVRSNFCKNDVNNKVRIWGESVSFSRLPIQEEQSFADSTASMISVSDVSWEERSLRHVSSDPEKTKRREAQRELFLRRTSRTVNVKKTVEAFENAEFSREEESSRELERVKQQCLGRSISRSEKNLVKR